MMKAAIEKAGSTDREAIHEAMKGLEYTGVSGSCTLDDSGSPIKNVVILQFVDGEPKYMNTVEPDGTVTDGTESK